MAGWHNFSIISKKYIETKIKMRKQQPTLDEALEIQAELRSANIKYNIKQLPSHLDIDEAK